MRKYVSCFLVLILISCNSSDSDTEAVVTTISDNTSTTITQADNDTSSKDTTTTTLAANEEYVFDKEKMSPFTGLELPPELWLKRPRRVIAFKIDNNLNARPQSGIQEADAVFEVLVEGGMTRLLAFFYDKTSTYLGPIRSARPTDPTLVRPYGGVLVVSGATGGLITDINSLGVRVLEEQPSPVMFRISDRKAPHNLYADTELVREDVDSKGFPFNPPAEPIYRFGTNQDNWLEGANRLTVKFSDTTTIIWKLDDKQYSRFIIDSYAPTEDAVAHNFVTRDGYSDILKSETVVVIQGPLYNDEATTLPSVLTVGVGPAYIFNNGKYITGNWRRTDISESFELYDDNQNLIYVPPSSQWVHVLPLSGEVTWSDS